MPPTAISCYGEKIGNYGQLKYQLLEQRKVVISVFYSRVEILSGIEAQLSES